jgi:hypothetical protein
MQTQLDDMLLVERTAIQMLKDHEQASIEQLVHALPQVMEAGKVLELLPFLTLNEGNFTSKQVFSGQTCACYLTLPEEAPALEETDDLKSVSSNMYRCASTSLALHLMKTTPDAKLEFEPTMSASAPDFEPPSQPLEGAAEELKQQQITQLY